MASEQATWKWPAGGGHQAEGTHLMAAIQTAPPVLAGSTRAARLCSRSQRPQV